MTFEVKFWGVRGSIACPSPNHVRYGGNTSCLEVQAGDTLIILDAGTGIRNLGESLLTRGIQQAHLLLTHVHWDHINGFPFFAPAYHPDYTFRILAAGLSNLGGIREVLSGQMAKPTFPVPIEAMRSHLVFEDFSRGEAFSIGSDVLVRTAQLNHPNGATAYRLEHGGKSLCYVTDTEHVLNKPDENVLGIIEGADLVIYDGMYTDEEFAEKIGWGHSTWQEAVRLCKQAAVGQLVIFHHEPSHDDRFMAQVEKQARKALKGTVVAREGRSIKLL
jgi:phosphoribosyl 1,2-cyclic phosphodiesterase